MPHASAPDPADTLALFLDLSTVLTGFALADLLGTGMGATYLAQLIQNAGSHATGALLGEYRAICDEHPQRDAAFLDAIAARLMTTHGPLAQNVITLWYLGQWNQLPGLWRDAHGAFATDQNAVVSAAAYKAGLLWTAIDSHPRGAHAPGYGTWTQPPQIPNP